MMLMEKQFMNLVFFDIDGTLALGRNVPESAQEALKELRSRGDLVFICTGRSLSYVQKNFHQYADGFICSNGRLAVKDREVLYDHPLESGMIREILRKLEPLNAGYAFFEKDSGWFGGNPAGYEAMASAWDPGFLKKGIDPDAIRAYNFDVWFENIEQRRQIEEALKDTCLLNPHGPHPTADVTVLGIDKGTALIHVAEELGVPIENTYAFGDGVNDLCMLESAGHGIAMGNAVDALKEKAEYVTTDIRNDGVKNGLLHYGLTGESR